MVRFLLLIFLLAAGVFGQTERPLAYRSITGAVRDPSDAAIVGAQMTLFDGTGRRIAQTTTDCAGNFHFDQLPLGEYQVQADQQDFNTTKVLVTVGSRDHTPTRIVLPIAVAAEQVTVQVESSAPVVNTEATGNQDANTLDRAALDRVPVFDKDYVTTQSSRKMAGSITLPASPVPRAMNARKPTSITTRKPAPAVL